MSLSERKMVKLYGIAEKNTSDKLQNIMMLRIYNSHMFFIKDIEKLATINACADGGAHLTKACHLQPAPKGE